MSPSASTRFPAKGDRAHFTTPGTNFVDLADVGAITLHPIVIDNCQTRPAEGAEVDAIAHRIGVLSRELGSAIRREHGALVVERVG